MDSFESHGIIIPYGRRKGKLKMICPECKDKRTNKRDRSLSVDLDKGVWKCHHCGWSGGLKSDDWRKRLAPKQEYVRPEPRPLAPIAPSVLAYFEERRISKATLELAKVDVGRENFGKDIGEKTVIHFNYFLDGELVNVKSRTHEKKFRLISGAELVPYNIDAISDTPECIITEGEFDCLSFIECGRRDVISVPNGAGNTKWLDEYMSWFDDKETIYIAVDTDDAGISMREELIRRFGAERCRIVTYGDDCKDANEHLQKHGKFSLMERLEEARFVKVAGLFSLEDYEEGLDRLYRHGLQKGKTIGHPNFDNLISFETKRLCIVTGVPSSGKSEFIDEMCVRLNNRYGWRAGFFSPENMPLEYHAAKLTEKIVGCKLGNGSMCSADYAAAKRHIADNFFHIMPEEDSSLSSVLKKAAVLVRRRGIKILVIDPFNRLDPEGSERLSETQIISRQLDMMTSFAQRYDVLVILMAHPTKINAQNTADGIPTLYNISGSAHFYNKADFGIVVHRDKAAGYTLVRVSKVKFRHLGEGGDAYFKYDVRNGRYAPLPSLDPTAVATFDGRNYLRTSLLENAELPPEPQIQFVPNDNFLTENDNPLPF